jgi:hypothetical protein
MFVFRPAKNGSQRASRSRHLSFFDSAIIRQSRERFGSIVTSDAFLTFIDGLHLWNASAGETPTCGYLPTAATACPTHPAFVRVLLPFRCPAIVGEGALSDISKCRCFRRCLRGRRPRSQRHVGVHGILCQLLHAAREGGLAANAGEGAGPLRRPHGQRGGSRS